MLKERVIDLINRYESGDDGWLTPGDVQEELEEIMDQEPYDNELSPKLSDAVNNYILQQHEADRGGGRIPDGGDEFIEEIKQASGWSQE